MDETIVAARDAAAAVKERLDTERTTDLRAEVAAGADGTPTLLIDRIAEEAAFDAIGTVANILSEEAGFVDNGQPTTIILDPVDGTRNAVHGIPFYCTSLAIGTTSLDSVKYGLVVNLLTGDRYEAFGGQGAFLNDRPITVTDDASDIIYVLVLGSRGNERSLRLATLYSTRALGAAALEMSLVGSGAAHAYVMPTETLRITDFAAAALIVREAGGEVYDATGARLEAPIDLNCRRSVVAVASTAVYEAIR
jgi:fructose-1,6-bisphosphatase/inositol monophosphatase family enzyme